MLPSATHRRQLLAAALLAAGCGNGPSDPPGGADAAAPIDAAGEPTPSDGCPAMFAADIVPDYHVAISAEEWSALWSEFIEVEAREDAGLPIKPYHPIRFRWQDSAEVDAMIRLKGQWSWREAVREDDPPKMQFVISFNEVDPGGRFMGQRKVELDMPRLDRSFLRQRLALSALRELGIPAQCANSARLLINGEYYGLYAAIERMDKEFLERVFPGQDQGDLWDAGWQRKTNQESTDDARIDAYWAAGSAAELAAIADLTWSVREWAAEAVINNGDGAYGGNHNYFLYDHPQRGFLWLPHDLDSTWDHRAATIDPIFPLRDEQPKPYYLMVMDDPMWRARYLKAFAEMMAGLDVTGLEDRVDRWAEQIADAAAADPSKPFTTEKHVVAVERLRGSISLRVEHLAGWFECAAGGGADGDGADGDGDGFHACHDCDDADGAARPGAAESPNQLDDDCDGRVDEGVSFTFTGEEPR